jgi:hypothetical protein
VKLGAPVALTGRYAVQGALVRQGLELWARDAGAELALVDDRSDPVVSARVHERLRGFGGTAFIVTSQHDELLIECDEADAEAVLEAAKEAMVGAMDGLVNASGRKVPIVVEGTIAKAWTKG